MVMLNEEERMLQNLVRDFAEREVMPRSAELDEKAEFSWDNWHGMARLGLPGIGVDPAYGGSGGGFRQLCPLQSQRWLELMLLLV